MMISYLREKVQNYLSVEKGEWLAFVMAFGWFVLVMLSYQMLRPIREALVSELPSGEKSWLFAGTLIAMTLAVPLYAKLVSLVNRRVLVLTLVNFFSVCILVFAYWNHQFSGPVMIRCFFIWVSVFSLYATSLVWSVLIDLFSTEQGKRLFGPIAGGATTGAIAGSALALQADNWGITAMMILAAVALELCLVLSTGLEFATKGWPAPQREQAVQGGILDGLREIIASPYLMKIIVYLIFISLFGTTIYLQITNVAKLELVDRDMRTSYFAKLNLFVQFGVLGVQLALVGPLLRKLGLTFALMLLPVVSAGCFVVLVGNGSLYALSCIDVVSRIATYGIAVPSREVLFTVVSRQAKYKSKNVIDTIVIRGADSFASATFELLRSHLTFSSICLLMLPLTGAWLFAANRLGRQQNKLAQEQR